MAAINNRRNEIVNTQSVTINGKKAYLGRLGYELVITSMEAISYEEVNAWLKESGEETLLKERFPSIESFIAASVHCVRNSMMIPLVISPLQIRLADELWKFKDQDNRLILVHPHHEGVIAVNGDPDGQYHFNSESGEGLTLTDYDKKVSDTLLIKAILGLGRETTSSIIEDWFKKQEIKKSSPVSPDLKPTGLRLTPKKVSQTGLRTPKEPQPLDECGCVNENGEFDLRNYHLLKRDGVWEASDENGQLYAYYRKNGTRLFAAKSGNFWHEVTEDEVIPQDLHWDSMPTEAKEKMINDLRLFA